MIEIKNLHKTYDGITNVVDDLSLKIEPGSVFGFLGPNGAGKSTTIKMLVGINKPDEGSVAIGGKPPTLPATRQDIGFMPEEPHFYDQLTGLELLEFTNQLFEHKRQKSKQELDKIMEKTGIYYARNKKIRNYSKGMKQRLGFSQALVNNPKYIFLDEPLEGLDPIGRREMKLIMDSIRKEGRTIFFNSHILADVELMCDRIGIIHKGKLVYSGPVREFCGTKSLEDQFVDTISLIDKK